MNDIFHRVSIRSFKEKPVEETKIERLLKAAMAAPSAGNQQPWEFYIVTGKQKLTALSKCSPYAGCAANAPAVIVACCKNSGIKFPEDAPLDMSAATENILLQAVHEGLGTVWLGIAPQQERMDAVKKVLDLPDTLSAFAMIPVGYPAKEVKPADRFDKSRIHLID